MVQPLSQVLHFEGISSGTDLGAGAKAYQVENLRKLHARWEAVLDAHRDNASSQNSRKSAIQRRVLFIDHCTPTPNEDAGSLVAFEIMQAFIANGYKVTFMPEDNFAHMGADTRDLQRLGIETIYHPAYSRMSAFLAARNDAFDVIFLHRFSVADAHLAALRRAYPRCADRVPQCRPALPARDAGGRTGVGRHGRGQGEAHPRTRVACDRRRRCRARAFGTRDAMLQREVPAANLVVFPLVHDPAPRWRRCPRATACVSSVDSAIRRTPTASAGSSRRSGRW